MNILIALNHIKNCISKIIKQFRTQINCFFFLQNNIYFNLKIKNLFDNNKKVLTIEVLGFCG